MRPWLIALFSLALGYSLWRVEDRSPLITRADRLYQNWLIDIAEIPGRPPVPITLVEMEDAANWTALEYALFLKALPKKDAPVIVATSLPASENTAFSRAFTNLALQQSRLILPITLSLDSSATRENLWWLKGWKPDSAEGDLPVYRSVLEAPPEVLRGTVAVGVANPPADANETPLYFRSGIENIPSLALRAVWLAYRIPEDQIRWDHGLMLGKYRLPTMENGSLAVDYQVLSKIPRIASSDLLLSLGGEDVPNVVKNDLLRGVVVLGDLTDRARTIPRKNDSHLTSAEWVAATIATISNSPVLTPVPRSSSLLILVGCILTPLIFFRQPGPGKWLAVVLLIGAYAATSSYVATAHGYSLPLFIPLLVFLFGSFLQHLSATYRS